MMLLPNDELLLTKAEFDALPEYSTTLPTGTTPGKAWKRHMFGTDGSWWRGCYGKPYPEGHEHHGQIPIGWRRIRLAGQAVRFPWGVRVPPAPMRGRIRQVPA